MELTINRLKYSVDESIDYKMVVSDSEDFPFRMRLDYFIEKVTDTEDSLLLNQWVNEKSIKEDSYITYSFLFGEEQSIGDRVVIGFQEKFRFRLHCFLLGSGLKRLGLIIDFNLIGTSISAFEKYDRYNSDWDLYRRYDFKLDPRKEGNTLFVNVGSETTLIGRNRINAQSEFGSHVKYLDTDAQQLKRISDNDSQSGFLLANYEIRSYFQISLKSEPINYRKRYDDLQGLLNNILRQRDLHPISFQSAGFDSLKSDKVSFSRNKLVFKNDAKDINPITGMRNHGVYRSAPEAFETKFLFVFQNRDDANNLYKFLKNGFKGFPGLERYVDVPVVLADSNEPDKKHKQFIYRSKETLIQEYSAFERSELPDDYYKNLFAIVIGDFDKSDPDSSYYLLKERLLQKGIASQFVNQANIRKTSVFNYHLPNIAIGIHAKLGGIPWRIESGYKNDLIIGFNQTRLNNRTYIGGSVFFDNAGVLRKTFSFEERETSEELIYQLEQSVNSYIQENQEIRRLVIHYHKSLSNKEKRGISSVLRKHFKVDIPYAVVEVNDTKSQLEIAFDPNNQFGMPVSGRYVRLSKKEYLLFNNNRFKQVAPIGVKDELPLKLRIHFADESGFSHSELIDQVYEFSRLIWKGLKQRSQPATSFYAKEISEFRAHLNNGIPNNPLTQSTPWFL